MEHSGVICNFFLWRRCSANVAGPGVAYLLPQSPSRWACIALDMLSTRPQTWFGVLILGVVNLRGKWGQHYLSEYLGGGKIFAQIISGQGGTTDAEVCLQICLQRNVKSGVGLFDRNWEKKILRLKLKEW